MLFKKTSFLGLVTFLFLLISSCAQAQIFSVSSNYIEILGDGSSGILGLGTSPSYVTLPSRSIMFAFPGPGGTSHITSWVNGSLYDYATGTVVTPMTSSGSGLGAFIEITKTVVAGLQMKAHYEIVNNPQTGLLPDTAMLQFVYTNVGAVPLTFGERVEVDTDINGVDGANISVNNGVSTIPISTMYRVSASSVPTQWWGYDIPPPGVANLVATGSIYNNSYDLPATEPDAFEVAYWPNVETAGQWTGPVGSTILDSAVVYWWTGQGDETVGNFVLNPGQNRTFTTYIGLSQIALLSTPTNTPTYTPSGPTATFTNTATVTPTFTFTHTATNTATTTCTNTATNSATQTATNTSTVTTTSTITDTPTITNTPTNSPTATSTPTPTCQIFVWPDPYNPAHAVRGTLKFDCLPPNGTITIYTLTGEKVIAIPVTDVQYEWNGRNTNHAPVSTGIYIYVIEGDGKVKKRDKFLIVNGS